MLIWVVVGAYLTIGSIYDKKCLLLPSWFLRIVCLMGTAWGLYRVFMEQIPWQQWITACLPGILWIILAFATREQMGYGDGVVLLVVGCLTDAGTTMVLLMMGLVIGCVWGILLLISKRGNRQTALPFIPMLLLAYMVMMGGRLVF